MNCPACQRPLRERGAGPFTVDVCHGGCGGIWFDAAELQRVDERVAAALHRVWQHPQRDLRQAAVRVCPRCAGQALERKWHSKARKVEIDQCPKCAGVFLDDGEFTSIFEELKQAAAILEADPRGAG